MYGGPETNLCCPFLFIYIFYAHYQSNPQKKVRKNMTYQFHVKEPQNTEVYAPEASIHDAKQSPRT